MSWRHGLHHALLHPRHAREEKRTGRLRTRTCAATTLPNPKFKKAIYGLDSAVSRALQLDIANVADAAVDASASPITTRRFRRWTPPTAVARTTPHQAALLPYNPTSRSNARSARSSTLHNTINAHRTS